MTLSSWRKGVMVAAVLAGGFRLGVAGAQNSAGSGAPAGGPQGTPVESQQNAVLGADQQLAAATTAADHMRDVRTRISDLLEHARQSGDVTKVDCLDDKLTRADSAIGSVTEHRSLLETAIGTNNDSQRNHEYSLITTFRQTVDAVESEAHQCVGEESSGINGTVRSYVPNQNVPTQDSTQYPTTTSSPEPLPPQTPVR